MLTIHTATSAAAVKKYFDTADYYSEGQETVGQWGGKAAGLLGLFGTVDKASFNRLCDNFDPRPQIDRFGQESFDRLTPRTNDFRRVGYDMVFSGPKSFSILHALASESCRRGLTLAFDASVRETMEELEGDMQVRVRKGGAQHDRPTGNLVWAEFDHSTSRPLSPKEFAGWLAANDNRLAGWAAGDDVPPDMQWHKHVFCFNATHDPVEDRFKAGEFSYAKRDADYYEAAFYSRLALRLEAMGYRIDRLGGDQWEIAGVPASAISTFSKRTAEIEKTVELLGITDAAIKAELGAKTRSGKQKEMMPDQLRQAWDAQLTDGERDALARVYAKEIGPGKTVTASEAVAFAIEHVSERLSVVPERELKRVALLHGLGQVTAEQIEAELPRHGVITDAIDGREMATTERLQAEERYIVGQAARGRGAARPAGVADGLTRTLANGPVLNDGQWQVTRGLLESANRVEVFEGPAGAGKSYSLRKFDEGLRLVGEKVTYLAATAPAVKVLAENGFAVNTVARFLLDQKMQKAAHGGRVVVDEASLVGHKDAVKLFRLAEKHELKLIFVGDRFQHGSVPRGALFRVLTDHAGIKPFRLSEIMRQQDAEYRAAAQLLSEGKTLQGIEALDGKGWVKETGDDAERRQAIAAEYVQAVGDKKSVLVISPTHAEAAAITQEIRGQLKACGELGEEETAFTRLVAVNATEAERGQAFTYRPGDVIQFHQNAKGHVKGERLAVSDPAAVPLAEAAKFSLYRKVETPLAVGEKIRFTGSVKAYRSEHIYRNGDTHTVTEITPGGNVRLDDGRLVAADAGHFRPAFVETSFGAQGRTVQRVIVDMSSASFGAVNQEQAYVSASRAKERVTLHTDDKAAMLEAAGRSSQKLAALDLKPKPRQWEAWQEQRDRQQRISLSGRLRAAWDRPKPGPERPRPGGGGRPQPFVAAVARPEQPRDYGHGR